MKKISIILLLISLVVSCSKPVNELGSFYITSVIPISFVYNGEPDTIVICVDGQFFESEVYSIKGGWKMHNPIIITEGSYEVTSVVLLKNNQPIYEAKPLQYSPENIADIPFTINVYGVIDVGINVY
ncbi:hypothetical protein M1M27_gp25 [Cellulophaga phage Ingeline_1]|uniref:Lipoprotein n=1 Tax=Cellulophaga phage Ingeline_1 TaxID=2745674 RepID=A0A8E4ZEP5_9CAUD|nr:hypothetical protein M1M27_gp25 [Cellulophaga phage Ingeline_1]QQV90013.1 hypothetical protein Ingeline2_26 [Cellulophaga phage Ingeline_2]QQV90063.1 hypothetical protein Ingeline3_26 [Cellulophaga phage Ingeline_3]QQV90113.1 hypothetical protein Ingeline4_26 [Cellulophaga phage Ingeline_4]QQV90163.1 hypothetical protein Ingeline5_26 [Cellulophaga phage Ingeline_5]QQV90212.1 hypothetical protein Ingeline6_26 [Cellulophaga phage Ingeline_6]QQV90262.1 hypothetical protein Ingeline7_26 [Cellu